MRMTASVTDAPDAMGLTGERLARVRGSASDFQAECISGDAVRESLDRAAASMYGATPFQARFWLTHWLNIFSSARCEPLLVTVCRSGEMTPVLVLPLVRREHHGRRIIEFVDAGVTDYNAPLVHPDFSVTPAEVGNLWDAIVMALPPADILLLDKMPRMLGTRDNPLAQTAAAHESQLHGNLVVVGDSFDAYVRGFHRKYRKEVGREKRVFEAFEGARFVAVRSWGEAQPVMDALERIQATRMARLHRDYDLDVAEKQTFYRAMLRDGLADGSVTLTALMVKDEVIAALYCINHNGHCAMVRIAQAGGAWSVCSPGRLIILETMRWLHAGGYRIFDFTIGAYEYKRRLGAAHVPLARVMMALSLGGQLAVTGDAIKRRLRTMPLLRRIVQRFRGTKAEPAEM